MVELIFLAQSVAFLTFLVAGSVLIVFLIANSIGVLWRTLIAAIPPSLLTDGGQIAFLAYEYGQVEIVNFIPTMLLTFGLSLPIAWIFTALLDRYLLRSKA